MKRHKFEATVTLQMETSYGVLLGSREENVKVECEVGIHDSVSGHFELYDLETGGERWYAEGSLSFTGKEVTDFDGVFDLPSPIKDKLIELGYKITW